MLEQEDIKQIGIVVSAAIEKNVPDIVEKTTNAVVLNVGEMIEQNVLPLIAALPDKDFVERQTASIKGTLVAKLRTEDEKVNLLISFLRTKNVLNDEQCAELEALEVFPKLSKTETSLL